MLKTAIKKTAITKVLSCFLVFVILMSAVPVSVLASDKAISDPSGSMHEWDTAKVSYPYDSPAHVDSVEVGDKVGVLGSYTGSESREYAIALEGSGDSLFNVINGAETQITTDTLDQHRPAISGDRIVWDDHRNGNRDIYMYDLSAGAEIQITTDPSGQYCPAMSGDHIVWQDYRNGNWDIYIYDLSTGAETQITTDPADQYGPAISGDRIVWHDCRNVNDNNNYDIYMYDISASTETQITTDPSGQYYPAISGDRIVWRDCRNANDDYNYDIYMYDLSASTETQITTDPSGQYPAISGDRIVWEDSRNGNRDIYLYDLSTGAETQITTNPSGQYYPAISGDRIVWHDCRNVNDDYNYDIYMYDLSASTETQITTDPSGQYHPAISGDRIVWDDWRNHNWDIYMYIVDDDTSPAPSPKIVDVLYYPSPCVNEGEYATITVTVRNNGVSSSEGYISVSFPHDEDISYVSGTGDRYNELIPIEKDISCATGTMISEHPLVELKDFDWDTGEEHTLTMTVKPNRGSAGIEFLVRAALKNDADGSYERVPTSGDKDQQGWYAERHSVDMCEVNILPVPYYNQGSTKWCTMNSISMILRYNEVDWEPWEIAAEYGKARAEGLDSFDIAGVQGVGGIDDKIKSKFGLDAETRRFYGTDSTEEIDQYIKDKVDDGHPVYVGFTREKHAIVAVGYNENHIFLHDPSGAITLNIFGEPSDRLIAAPILWDDFNQELIDGRSWTDFITTVTITTPIEKSETHGSVYMLDYDGGSYDGGIYFQNRNAPDDKGALRFDGKYPEGYRIVKVGELSVERTSTKNDIMKLGFTVANPTSTQRYYVVKVNFINSDTGVTIDTLSSTWDVGAPPYYHPYVEEEYQLSDIDPGAYTLVIKLFDDADTELDTLQFDCKIDVGVPDLFVTVTRGLIDYKPLQVFFNDSEVHVTVQNPDEYTYIVEYWEDDLNDKKKGSSLFHVGSWNFK